MPKIGSQDENAGIPSKIFGKKQIGKDQPFAIFVDSSPEPAQSVAPKRQPLATLPDEDIENHLPDVIMGLPELSSGTVKHSKFKSNVTAFIKSKYVAQSVERWKGCRFKSEMGRSMWDHFYSLGALCANPVFQTRYKIETLSQLPSSASFVKLNIN